MIKDQCISVTDLRTNTKQCLQGLGQEPKYIFINNRPVAVLMDIVFFENSIVKPKLIELDEIEVNEKLKKEARAAGKLKKSELSNI